MVEIGKKKKRRVPNTSQIQQDKFMFLGKRITLYNLILTLLDQSPVLEVATRAPGNYRKD